MSGHEWIRIATADRRELEVVLAGDARGIPLVFQNGTPTAAARWPRLSQLASELGAQALASVI